MSVNACDREGCENVMCDTLIDNYYLCPECVGELLRIKEEWPPKLTKTELSERILEFVESEKKDTTEVDRDEELNRLLGIKPPSSSTVSALDMK